ncbi:MAG TPA: tetratricopeptide repeat protein, partial [Casimicrobiaceae bacterium]
LLTGGRRTALPRQRTLRALVDWSYDLLSIDERVALMAVSTFAGGFTLAAAEEVCDASRLGEMSVLDAIERLIAKSLVVAEHDHGGDTRYRLLETIRQYGAEKLVDAGTADTMRQRHFAYFRALAERAEPELRKANVLEWLDRLEADHDNLRAALDWAADADAKGYARLAGSLHEFWDIRGHFVEGHERLERALALHPALDTARVQALLGAGALAYRLDRRDHSATLLEAATALARRLSDTRREAEAIVWLGGALDSTGADFIESVAEKALTLSRSIDNAWGIGFAVFHFAIANHLRGQLDDAERLFLESAAHFDRGGCVLRAALARTWAGQCAIDRLDFDGARELLEGALAEHLRLGNVHDAATTRRALGKLRLNVGRLHDARSESEESTRIFRALQDPHCGARSTIVLAEVLHALGDDSLALEHLEQSTAVLARLGFDHNRAIAQWLAGRCHESLGDHRAARQAYLEALHCINRTSVTSPVPGMIEALAGAHPGAPFAPRLLGFAAAMRKAANLSALPSDESDRQRWIAAVQRVHRDRFESEFATGRSMTRDDAIAAARALATA